MAKAKDQINLSKSRLIVLPVSGLSAEGKAEADRANPDGDAGAYRGAYSKMEIKKDAVIVRLYLDAEFSEARDRMAEKMEVSPVKLTRPLALYSFIRSTVGNEVGGHLAKGVGAARVRLLFGMEPYVLDGEERKIFAALMGMARLSGHPLEPMD